MNKYSKCDSIKVCYYQILSRNILFQLFPFIPKLKYYWLIIKKGSVLGQQFQEYPVGPWYAFWRDPIKTQNMKKSIGCIKDTKESKKCSLSRTLWPILPSMSAEK